MNFHKILLTNAILAFLLTLTSESDVHAGAVSQSLSKAISNKAAGSAAKRAATSKAITHAAPGALTATEKAELQRILAQLDRDTLIAIQKRYAVYIPAERLQLAQSLPVAFKDKAAYQRYLQKAFPNMTTGQRARVLGNYDFRTGVARANINNARLPRVVAHERIHQLGHPGFRGVIGHNMDEGLTEYLASRVYGNLAIKDLPRIYPRQRRIAEMMTARIGPEKLSRAYFQGDLAVLESSLDRQLGRGSLARISRAMDAGDFNTAERILVHGLPPLQ